LIQNTNFFNSRSRNNGGGLFIGTNNVFINITYCSFVNNTANKGGALYFDKDNSNVIIVGSIFHKNTALLDGGACYFQNAINNLLFIDEIGYNSIFSYSNSIPMIGTEIKVNKFSHELCIIILSFDSISSEFISLNITVDKKLEYQGFMTTTNTYFGVSSPPLLLKVNETIDINVRSKIVQDFFIKFSLFPVFINKNGRKNIFSDNKAIDGDGGAINFHSNNNFIKILNTDFLNNIANDEGYLLWSS